MNNLAELSYGDRVVITPKRNPSMEGVVVEATRPGSSYRAEVFLGSLNEYESLIADDSVGEVNERCWVVYSNEIRKVVG